MTEHEIDIICLDCESNPCLCENISEPIMMPETTEPEPPEEPIYEPPCMVEPDFYNCENCGAEIDYNASGCHSCRDNGDMIDDIPIEDNWEDQDFESDKIS